MLAKLCRVARVARPALLWIVTVSKNNVDVWCFEPGKRALQALDDVLL
jgi:hypothetical protein